jgi:hypothetical protein
MFKDISNFENWSDFLPILSGCLIAEVIIIIMAFTYFKGSKLRSWYNDFGLSAVIIDVLILIIGFIITRFLYNKIFSEFSIIKFLLLALIVQIIHDVLFYYLLVKPMPVGANRIFDIFKDYGVEVGGGAIIGDSFMMILSILFASFLAGTGANTNSNINTNIIIIVFAVYLIPYLINTKVKN